MPRILLVKTSSLGDIVHNLPVASDIRAQIPAAEIHWVVEEALAPIPKLHTAVQRVIPAAVRRWRNSWWRPETVSEVQAFVRALRATRYDAVIDTQGLLKSALVARAARGTRYGPGWQAWREPLFMLYDHTFHVQRTQHAVERNRSLAAQALRYIAAARVDYGISAARASCPWLTYRHYAVLIHATSARGKLWSEERWIAVGKDLAARGMSAVLPWGSTAEHDRSLRLAASIPEAVVPPALDLSEVASVLSGARCAIGVDTGLTHLAGALGTATVGIYRSTDPAGTGLYGCARGLNLGGGLASPTADEVLQAVERLSS